MWPNYIRDHAWILRDTSTAEVDAEAALREGVRVVPGDGEWGMEQLLVHESERLMRELERSQR